MYFDNNYVFPFIETASIKMRRDRHQSSVYDPFAGMKTPGQRELITLQERVKLGMISVDEAVLEFKEWQLNQKRRSDSFRFQQVCIEINQIVYLHNLFNP